MSPRRLYTWPDMTLRAPIIKDYKETYIVFDVVLPANSSIGSVSFNSTAGGYATIRVPELWSLRSLKLRWPRGSFTVRLVNAVVSDLYDLVIIAVISAQFHRSSETRQKELRREAVHNHQR